MRRQNELLSKETFPYYFRSNNTFYKVVGYNNGVYKTIQVDSQGLKEHYTKIDHEGFERNLKFISKSDFEQMAVAVFQDVIGIVGDSDGRGEE